MAVEWDVQWEIARRHSSKPRCTAPNLGRSKDQESRVVREMRRGQVRKVRPAALSSIRPTGFTSSCGTSNINGPWSPAPLQLHRLRLRLPPTPMLTESQAIVYLHEVDPDRVRHVVVPRLISLFKKHSNQRFNVSTKETIASSRISVRTQIWSLLTVGWRSTVANAEVAPVIRRRPEARKEALKDKI